MPLQGGFYRTPPQKTNMLSRLSPKNT
ncbi:hypothetical protein J0S82_009064 [Galemys pyrenaicus]|uniref:Uncharacterized protein n=1 Tax=Galemys pyrenaicus TaxID=202257 RepID=A0A8J6DVX8_GALPY|nr:hypothetical protein J0S82_009064 [Galemys pyrenaicus]